MLFINCPGDYDAYQSWRATEVNERRKMEILGSMEGLAELASSEYLMTVKEAKINAW